ncbi:MAG: hypothetical protein ACI358_10025 [Candidatus Limimorpha sp.]
MIQHLSHNQINNERWDECVCKCLNGNIYAWSWYLDIIHPGWEALVEDDYKTVMPLTGKTKFGINYLFQPFFAQQLGIFSIAPLTEETINAFISAIPSKYKFAEIRLNSLNIIDKEDLDIKLHRNIEMPLSDEYQTIAQRYNSNTKRNIAKAKNAALTFTDNADPRKIISLFRNNRGKSIKHWGDSEYARLLTLVNTAIARQKCLVCGVNDENNELVAGAFFMMSHNRITFLFSGAEDSNRHPLSLLLDRIIMVFSGTQYTFDFEGSDNENLARFYKGFGGLELPYPELRLNRLSPFTRAILKILKNK